MALTALLALAGVTGCGGGDDNSADTGGLQDAGSVQAASVAAAWSPAFLYASLAPGESNRFYVQFTASGNSKRLDVNVVPEISPYVVILPRSFSDVRAGQVYRLEVTLRSPAPMAVGVKDGVIQLREGRRVWSRPLPVDLTFSPIPLPPDPGAQGMATIEGVDADGDGVRDDIQRYVGFLAYKTESGHAALTQLAKAEQAILLAEDPEAIRSAAEAVSRAIQCLFFVRGERSDAAALADLLQSEILNTVDRSLRYIAAQSALSGMAFTSQPDDWPNMCDFDPMNMDVEARVQ